MSGKKEISKEALNDFAEIQHIGTEAVKRAQAENRRLGIPNAYSQNGTLYFELPDGTITQDDPFVEEKQSGEDPA
jgi:CMP-N-acetylneuraminic acid synthetase